MCGLCNKKQAEKQEEKEEEEERQPQLQYEELSSVVYVIRFYAYTTIHLYVVYTVCGHTIGQRSDGQGHGHFSVY